MLLVHQSLLEKLLIEALLISNKATSFFVSFIQINLDTFVLCRFFAAFISRTVLRSSPLATGSSRGSAFISRLKLLINVILIFTIFNIVCEVFLWRRKDFLSFDVGLLLRRSFIISRHT
ncbi:hypothetical protein KC356_g314 [Hortaea werneckii]|nr:hypothetical protein KC356_g314 [Hortaea werneckii]